MADISKVDIDGVTKDIVSKGMPPAGSAGHVLKKVSNADYDTEWGPATGEVTIDTQFDDESGNPVANSVITRALNSTWEEMEQFYNEKLSAPAIPAIGPGNYFIGCVQDSETLDWYWAAKLLPIINDPLSGGDEYSVPSMTLYRYLRRLVSEKVDKPLIEVTTGTTYLTRTNTGLALANTWNHTDKTLSVNDGIADAKATGDALALKANSADVHGVPSGGGSGQVLKKLSATDYDYGWVTDSGGGGGGGGGGTSDYNDLLNKPQINGVTLVGNKTLAQIGAIAAPSSPATGAFLVWNGTAWVAQTLSTWQGGSY